MSDILKVCVFIWWCEFALVCVCVCECMHVLYMFLQVGNCMAAEKESKETTGCAGQLPPEESSVVLCHVMSCHCPDLLTQYQHEYFACVKGDYVFTTCFYPGLSVRVHKNRVVVYSILCVCLSCTPTDCCAACPLCWPVTLVRWNNANNYPYCTHSEKNERALSQTHTHTRTFTCLSNCLAKAAIQLPYKMMNIYVHCFSCQLLLCISDMNVSTPLHLNLKVCN